MSIWFCVYGIDKNKATKISLSLFATLKNMLTELYRQNGNRANWWQKNRRFDNSLCSSTKHTHAHNISINLKICMNFQVHILWVQNFCISLRRDTISSTLSLAMQTILFIYTVWLPTHCWCLFCCWWFGCCFFIFSFSCSHSAVRIQFRENNWANSVCVCESVWEYVVKSRK